MLHIVHYKYLHPFLIFTILLCSFWLFFLFFLVLTILAGVSLFNHMLICKHLQPALLPFQLALASLVWNIYWNSKESSYFILWQFHCYGYFIEGFQTPVNVLSCNFLHQKVNFGTFNSLSKIYVLSEFECSFFH